jgi:acetone carboxylase gamma subunit
MTAKQKANQARFKKVVAEAKKLRKKNPKLTQAQAVKQAWAMTYTKKKVGAAPKKKAAKKSSSYHKDTKSHNVNIRVMSGTKDFSGKILDQLNETLNRISNAQEAIDKLKIGLKYKQFSKEDIPEARKRVKKYTEYMKGLKKHFRELKKQFS